MLRQLLAASVLITFLADEARTQPRTGTSASAPRQALAEFEGQYRYRDGGTLFMIAQGEGLVAIIGEGKYALRRVATDTFTNPGGSPIPFVRDSSRRIVAFKENGDSFARLSSSIDADVRALLEPRPKGPDGKPIPYRCTSPRASNDGIRVSTPRSGTVTCDVAAQIVNGIIDGTYPDVRGIIVHHKGTMMIEEYFYGYDRDRPHQMRSLTKSIVSLLAGAAVDRGMLRADEPIVARLGFASIANPDPRKQRITLVDLLSNQSGLACDDRDGSSPGNESKLYETTDWVKAFIDLPVLAEPGTVGRYCSFGFMAAGRSVELAARKPLPDFAQEALFNPLGVSRNHWRWTYTLDRSQRNEFGQIYLRPRDMLKLGLLVAQRGAWQGRQVISQSWMDAAVAKQSKVDDSDYGLGIWHRWYGVSTANGTQRVETIMLSGNGGQKVFVVPTLDLVVVFTGGSFNVESPVNTLMARILLPALLQ